jgi:hypothetical protein
LRIESEMQAANISAVLLAIVLWAAPSFAFTVAAAAAVGGGRAAILSERLEAALPYVRAQAGGDRLPVSERTGEFFTASLARARELLEVGYARAPAFIIVLSALLLLPLVALASYVVQRAMRSKAQRAAMAAMIRKAESAEWADEAPIVRSIPRHRHEAWLVIGEDRGHMVPLTAHMTRIGRHPDNDVRLPDPSVHRNHALIERRGDAEFMIADLSGKEGNGVRINGERLERAHLVDGDIIELGRTRLKFESVPI